MELLRQRYEKEERLNSKELAELREKLGDESLICFAEKGETTWTCICGTRNDSKDENCKNCNRNRDFVLENCTEK